MLEKIDLCGGVHKAEIKPTTKQPRETAYNQINNNR